MVNHPLQSIRETHRMDQQLTGLGVTPTKKSVINVDIFITGITSVPLKRDDLNISY